MSLEKNENPTTVVVEGAPKVERIGDFKFLKDASQSTWPKIVLSILF